MLTLLQARSASTSMQNLEQDQHVTYNLFQVVHRVYAKEMVHNAVNRLSVVGADYGR